MSQVIIQDILLLTLSQHSSQGGGPGSNIPSGIPCCVVHFGFLAKGLQFDFLALEGESRILKIALM